MALPISVPYSFANATTSIPLSQLDTDISTIYATVNGIGNGTVALSNVVITGGIVSNVSGISTSAISNGTSNVSIATANGSVTVATAGNTAVTVDTSQNMTTVGTVAMGSSFKRNRAINGNMVIDQRNAGASGTATAYTVDRWYYGANQSSKFTWQQNAGSVTPPTGFTNYLGLTSSSAYTVLAGDYFHIIQPIEGINVADFAFGTASAKTVTVSFWVRSSLTGAFGAVLRNGNATYAYPFQYTISSANTWEYKTVTIPGATSGTWVTTTSAGMAVAFGLGVGTTYSAPVNAWIAQDVATAQGVNVVGTNGATFYITGVQLEVGTKATPYEMQIISDQLVQCQRYYEKSYNQTVTPGTATYVGSVAYSSLSAGYNQVNSYFAVVKRTDATITIYNPQTGASGSIYGSGASSTAFSVYPSTSSYYLITNGVTINGFYNHQWTASAEL
jgi:hypothetical protein